MSSMSDVISETAMACSTLLALVNGSPATPNGMPAITISAEEAGRQEVHYTRVTICPQEFSRILTVQTP